MLLVAPVRVVVADVQQLVRNGLSALVSLDGDICVVGEASSGSEAVSLARGRDAHVLLLDPAIDASGGFDTIDHVARDAPSVRMLVIAESHYLHRASRLLAAGALGFLAKSASAAELRDAIRCVAHGKSYLDPGLSAPVVRQAVAQLLAAPAKSLLTARQREVLKLLVEGKSNKEIASVLNVSVKTVETHRSQLMQRLGARDLPALVHYALAEGLIRGVVSK
jgi:DNA-binding NarL/FixJ family response regulator